MITAAILSYGWIRTALRLHLAEVELDNFNARLRLEKSPTFALLMKIFLIDPVVSK